LSRLTDFFSDRIQVNSLLIVLCFVSVLLLSSQSAASYATYLLALAMLFTVRQWNDVFRVRLLWLILLLLAYLTLSSFWSTPFQARDVFSALTRAVLIFFFVVAFAEAQQRGQLRRWLARALAVVGSLAAAAAIVVYVVTDPWDGRLNGLGQLDTHVIAALVFGVVLVFVMDILLTDSSSGWRWLALVAALLVVPAIVLSDSRNAIVSSIVGVGVFLTAHCIRDRQRFVAGVLSLAVILAVLLAGLLANDLTRDVVLPRGDSFRPIIWGVTLERVSAGGLWFGLGISTPDNVQSGGIEFLHPHSMYLSVLYQGGLVGVTLFLAGLFWVLTELRRSYEHPDAKLALGVLGVALPAYLLDGHELLDKVGSTWFLLWLPVAIGVGLRWSRPRQGL
jgi:O-antigen ligase